MNFDLDFKTDYDILRYKNMKSIKLNKFRTDFMNLVQINLTD